jgi:hypothetical protein
MEIIGESSAPFFSTLSRCGEYMVMALPPVCRPKLNLRLISWAEALRGKQVSGRDLTILPAQTFCEEVSLIWGMGLSWHYGMVWC